MTAWSFYVYSFNKLSGAKAQKKKKNQKKKTTLLLMPLDCDKPTLVFFPFFSKMYLEHIEKVKPLIFPFLVFEIYLFIHLFISGRIMSIKVNKEKIYNLLFFYGHY